jgi:hypothetical protein
VWQWRRGCNRGYSDQFTCSAISAKGSTSEWKCGTACARPCQRRPRPARLPAPAGTRQGPHRQCRGPRGGHQAWRGPGGAPPSCRSRTRVPDRGHARLRRVLRGHARTRGAPHRRCPFGVRPLLCPVPAWVITDGVASGAWPLASWTPRERWQARPSGRASVVVVNVFITAVRCSTLGRFSPSAATHV